MKAWDITCISPGINSLFVSQHLRLLAVEELLFIVAGADKAKI
ncbi:hypothetical protein Emin_1541 [Elusimicrobium minutum Pei191]|uniref:Uncharacterized protein n=1 Tax=Elusimicrobium minutum (strain Pei191) TaxID=445932 RepID=B2KEZ2_ELUMP|nr:hypothetical protein [Elusimicrobium minutum]ACC99088.1 hypothetical protein Emin_1541 [Elusimicrobium minutum Pei191]